MSAGSLNNLFPQSGAGMGMAMADPQNISSLQNWPQLASSYTPQQTQTIDQLGNIFGQFVNPTSLGNVPSGGIGNLLTQAVQALGVIPYGVR